MPRVLLIILFLIVNQFQWAYSDKKNVLFVIADDLMKQIEMYGDQQIKTPNLKKLAKESLLMDRAYCQYPLCGPSRASLMLSKYPSNTGITWNQGGKSSTVQKKAKDLGLKTMPAYFKEHGYITVGGGKLYHNNVVSGEADTKIDFTEVLNNHGRDGIKVKTSGKDKKTKIVESSDYGIYEHKDGALVNNAKKWLAYYSNSNNPNPFFMCIGLKKPHSPFSAPKQFFDLYQRDNMEPRHAPIPEGILEHYSLNKASSLLSVHSDTDLFDSYTLPHAKKKEIVHGYHACVTYIDFLVGDLIKSLKEHNLFENTIIVFTSDHGYKLGEYDRWAKYTLQEKDAVLPFLIRAPGYQSSFGKISKSIIGLIDVFPTLTELCQLPLPQNIDGKSFIPALKNSNNPSRTYIRTVLPRQGEGENPRAAGMSLIHENGFRYHQWWEGELSSVPSKDEIISYELYDHYSNNNSAISLENVSSKFPEILEQLRLISSKR